MTEENPYLDARKKHNEYESSRNASLRLWKLFGLLGLLTGLAGVGGMIHIGSQSKFVPYVIEVDKLGQTLPVSVADKAAPADPRIVSSLLARAITLARMVTPDVVVQRNAIFELYASLDSSDPAALKMQEYLGSDSDTSPFKRAAKKPWTFRLLRSSLNPTKHGKSTGWKRFALAATVQSYPVSECGRWSASM